MRDGIIGRAALDMRDASCRTRMTVAVTLVVHPVRIAIFARTSRQVGMQTKEFRMVVMGENGSYLHHHADQQKPICYVLPSFLHRNFIIRYLLFAFP